MAVYLRPGSTVWVIKFRRLGRTFKRSSGSSDKSVAIRRENLWKGLIEEAGQAVEPPWLATAQGSTGASSEVEERPTITVQEAVDRYIQVVIKPRCKPGAAEREAYALGAMVRRVGPDRLLHELTAIDLAKLRDGVVADGLAPATANRYAMSLMTVMRRATEDWGFLETYPVVRLFRLNNMRFRWIDAEEELSLLQACTPQLRWLVIFLLETGARLGEALGLTWKEVDWEREPRPVAKFINTKSGKPRGVPLSQRCQDLLRQLQSHHATVTLAEDAIDRIFIWAPTGRGGRGRQTGTWKPYKRPFDAWRRAVAEAGLEDLNLHDLRHTFASRLVQRGVPLAVVKELLGHATIQMTMRYAHLSPNGLDSAITTLEVGSVSIADGPSLFDQTRVTDDQIQGFLALPLEEIANRLGVGEHAARRYRRGLGSQQKLEQTVEAWLADLSQGVAR